MDAWIPTLDDVQAAARRLRGHIHRTPVIVSRSFDDASGHRVLFKCENLQRAGSFKIRGALTKLLTLTAERLGTAGPGGRTIELVSGAPRVPRIPLAV